MKKTILFAMAMLVSVASFAQKKGDVYVSATYSTEFGEYTTSSSLDGFATSKDNSFGNSFSLGAGFGYFVADNLRLGLSVEAPFSTTPMEEIDGETLEYKSVTIDVTPNVAYYVKLSDWLYYVPEVGAYLGWGFSKDQLTLTETEDLTNSSWGFYTDLLSFEFKVSEKFSITTKFGGLGWYSIDYKYPDHTYRMTQFVGDINHATVHFGWYF